MLYSGSNCQCGVVPMQYRRNKPLRNLGIYKLLDRTLILFKRSEALSFLFSFEGWNRHGPVEYRVSHGQIYQHGNRTPYTDEDLFDTGQTANPPSLSILVDNTKL